MKDYRSFQAFYIKRGVNGARSFAELNRYWRRAVVSPFTHLIEAILLAHAFVTVSTVSSNGNLSSSGSSFRISPDLFVQVRASGKMQLIGSLYLMNRNQWPILKCCKILNYDSSVVLDQEFTLRRTLGVGRPPQLRVFVCAYHPAAPGSNPKHTIYAF